MFTDVIEPLRRRERPSPLAVVTAALENAAELGELSPAELEWSLARLSGRTRNRENDAPGSDRREAILRAATSVFLLRGYNHATIEEVSGELSLTKAGVYHYFASKQEILEAICDASLAAAEAVIGDGLRSAGAPADRLRDAAERYAELVMADQGLLLLIRHFDELSEPVAARIQKRRRRLAALLRRTLDEGVADGSFAMPDSEIAVLGLLGTLNWIYSWYDDEGPLSAADVRDVLVRQLLSGVIAPVGGREERTPFR